MPIWDQIDPMIAFYAPLFKKAKKKPFINTPYASMARYSPELVHFLQRDNG